MSIKLLPDKLTNQDWEERELYEVMRAIYAVFIEELGVLVVEVHS